MALLARASGNKFRFSDKSIYKLFSINLAKSKLCKKLLSSSYNLSCLKYVTNIRCASTAANSLDTREKKTFLNFDDFISQRRDQAKRSLLVQVQAENSSHELYNYCSQYSKVQEMHHYTLNNGVHFLLIEFNSRSDIEAMNSVLTHINIHQNLPVYSPWVWFRAAEGGSNKKGTFSKDIPLKVTDGKYSLTSEQINHCMYSAKSISDQMTVLHNSIKLNDTDIRLRFLSARQIESCFSGMFTDVSVLPFGSSVNGFGKHGCDLDLVLKLQTNAKENPNSRLIYHTKALSLNEKIQAQKVMEAISDVMQQFLPGISSIRRILKARVPIIKYHQTLTGLECDLSMTNTIGVHMSELLYLYGELDWRVRPLIFTIRMWAQCVQLTNSSPGSWITNFSLTLLVLFYLQQRKILPSLQELVKHASKNDVRIADCHVDCTFLRDLSRFPKPVETNKETLEELLTNFFIYYAGFDFATKAISLNEGVPLPKPKASNVYIFNPLEQGLNVTKNMNVQETERLRIEMRNAAWLLDSAAEIKSREWGLLSLFRQKVEPSNINDDTTILNTGNRMLELSTLFKNTSFPGDRSKTRKNPDTVEPRNKGVSVSLGILGDRQQVSSNKKFSSRKRQGKR